MTTWNVDPIPDTRDLFRLKTEIGAILPYFPFADRSAIDCILDYMKSLVNLCFALSLADCLIRLRRRAASGTALFGREMKPTEEAMQPTVL